MRQATFNWKPRGECASWQEFDAQPGVVESQRFRETEPLLQHGTVYGKRVHYTHADLDDVRIEMREVLVDLLNLDDSNGHVCGVQYTFDVRAVIVENATDLAVRGEGSFGGFFWDDEKHAQRKIKQWKKAISAAAADAETLAEFEPATRRTAFFTKEQVAALPIPTADTQVGDIVAVRGFGKNRAGVVIEVTPKRVKCVIRTVESTKREGDNGYIKWFKIGQDARL